MKNIFSLGKLSGKGLAIAVGISLLVIGAAGIYSYTALTNKLNSELISQNNTKPPSDIAAGDNDTPVDVPINDVVRTPSVTTVTAGTANPAEEAVAPADDIPADAAEDILVENPGVNQAMVRPINGEVINSFSDGELTKSNTLNVWKTHDGVDIAGEMGEKVKSMTGGVVSSVYEDTMLGSTIVIDHGNGLEGYYSNLDSDIQIAEGDKVSAGTVIGLVGNTAESEINEDPHLHFSLKKNGEWIDPISLISGEGS